MKKNRPEWNDCRSDPIRTKPLNPPWAAETVFIEPKNISRNIQHSPELEGGNLPEDMIWQCPYCEKEWHSKEPGVCPKCKTELYAPRPTFGLMYPLIAAMDMIDKGYDPNNGEIDIVMDSLMKQQVKNREIRHKTNNKIKK